MTVKFRAVYLAVLLAAFAVAPASFANLGADDEGSSTDPNYAEALNAIGKKEWKPAIDLLNKALTKDKDNADIHNALAFSYRNSGDLDHAFKHYEQALKLNPKHRNAYEYLGEAYLMAGKLDKAQEQFRNLERLCPRGCEQMDMLKAKIEEFQKKSASN